MKLTKPFKFSVGDILQIKKNGDVCMPKGQNVRVVEQKRAIYDNMVYLEHVPEEPDKPNRWFFEEDLEFVD